MTVLQTSPDEEGIETYIDVIWTDGNIDAGDLIADIP